MERLTKRKAVIGGSTLIVAGALAGVFTFSAGGHGTTTHRDAAGAVQAQRVADDGTPAAAGSPGTPQASPGGGDSSNGDETPTSGGHIDLLAKNTSDHGGQICVANAVTPTCIKIAANSPLAFPLSADIPPHETIAVVAGSDVNGPNKHDGSVNLPLNGEKQCVQMTNDGFGSVPGCQNF